MLLLHRSGSTRCNMNLAERELGAEDWIDLA
jgi:hypothetical protein